MILNLKTGLVVCVTLLVAVGCATPPPPVSSAPKSYVVLMNNQDGTVGELSVSTTEGDVLLNKSYSGVDLDGTASSPYTVDESRIKRDFGEAFSAQPPLPVSFVLHYNIGDTVLTVESQAMIPAILEATKNRPAPDVSVIGHTDTMGTVEANEILGMERAKSVAEIIKNAGLKVQDLTISSHGEKNLMVATPDNTPEPKNRRVEITIR
ncbi:MAG: OmpA family protein [Desulfobacterales bacterium]